MCGLLEILSHQTTKKVNNSYIPCCKRLLLCPLSSSVGFGGPFICKNVALLLKHNFFKMLALKIFRFISANFFHFASFLYETCPIVCLWQTHSLGWFLALGRLISHACWYYIIQGTGVILFIHLDTGCVLQEINNTCFENVPSFFFLFFEYSHHASPSGWMLNNV